MDATSLANHSHGSAWASIALIAALILGVGGCPVSESGDNRDEDGDRVAEQLGDCDDGDPAVLPGAAERCNGVDDDCDGEVDEGHDADGDGYTSCGVDGVFGTRDDDCDDGDPLLHPADEDGDGWSVCSLDCDDGDPSMTPADADGDGWSSCEGDCDDDVAAVYPTAPETCDRLDSDCDGILGVAEIDRDADGVAGCEGDCDDFSGDVYPGAFDACDGVDSDCDGVVGSSIGEFAPDGDTVLLDHFDGESAGTATDAELVEDTARLGSGSVHLPTADSEVAYETVSIEQGTVEFWYMPEPDSRGWLITGAGSWECTGCAYFVVGYSMSTTGKVTAKHHGGSGVGWTDSVKSTTVLQPERWYHIAYSWGSDGASLFIDGLLEASSDDTKALAPQVQSFGVGNVFTAGCCGAGSPGATGYYDELRFSSVQRDGVCTP